MKKINAFLNTTTAFRVLLAVNLVTLAIGFYLGFMGKFGDEESYLSLAKSIRHGTFSQWYFMPFETAETLRAWGYSFFIYLVQFISDSTTAIKVVQLLLAPYRRCVGTEADLFLKKEIIYRNLFLLLLAPNIQLSFYAGQLAPESLTQVFLVLFVFVWYTWPKSWTKYTVLAVVAFLIYQVKPAFLLFPFMWFAIEFFLFQKLQIQFVVHWPVCCFAGAIRALEQKTSWRV
jgi:hypothetical protein